MFTRQPDITEDRIRRFEAKTTPLVWTDCVAWIGGTNEHGYGVFWNGARLEKAHRFALRASGVFVPDDSDVCHTCDNPFCVNAAHLFVGDAQANVTDMWAKSRATVLRHCGTQNYAAKLDDRKVADIRAKYAAGGWTQYELADLYGVSQRAVWNVIHYTNWKRPSGLVVERGRSK